MTESESLGLGLGLWYFFLFFLSFFFFFLKLPSDFNEYPRLRTDKEKLLGVINHRHSDLAGTLEIAPLNTLIL